MKREREYSSGSVAYSAKHYLKRTESGTQAQSVKTSESGSSGGDLEMSGKAKLNRNYF
jgi:hypothetical protein